LNFQCPVLLVTNGCLHLSELFRFFSFPNCLEKVGKWHEANQNIVRQPVYVPVLKYFARRCSLVHYPRPPLA
jgi:hypothetical protein